MQLSWNWPLLALIFALGGRCVEFSLAGIYTVHNADAGMECDSIVPVNAVLTFFHQRFISEANEKLEAYGMSLTTQIADSCDDPSVTLQKLVPILGQSKNRCEASIGVNGTNSLLAVTGAFSSDIGDNVNYLLQAFCIPVIESVSSSLSLDDPTRYPYFVRTSPSDIFRTQAIVDLLQSQHFVHVSVIYDGSDFGSSMYTQFKTLIDGCKTPGGIFQMPCVEGAYEVDFRKKTTMSKVEQQLLELKTGLNTTSVKVIVIFMNPEAAQLLFFYLTFWGYKKGDFIYIFAHQHDLLSELTEFSFAVIDHLEPYQEANKILQEDQDTILTLIPNRYMRELIMSENACCLDLDQDCGYSMQCSGDERLDNLTDYDLKQIRTVYNAINLVAHSLIGIHKKMCPTDQLGEDCETMAKNLTGKMLLEQMMRTTFTDEDGHEFKLYNRSARPSFDIVQMQDGYWMPVLLDYDPFIGPQPNPNLSEVRYPPNWDEIQEENRECQAFCHEKIVVPRGVCCWKCQECPGPHMYIEKPMQGSPMPELLSGRGAQRLLQRVCS
uniref:ANF_receptor domain-containing protein n=1 Tax=Steinernema glaseri TaxID=37863 RepID=A0A1I7YT73_9BILA